MPFSSLLISCLFLLSHALWQSHWDWQTQPPPLFLECASWWQSMFCHYLPHMDPHAGILQGCSGWRSLKFAIISHVLEKLDEKFPEKHSQNHAQSLPFENVTQWVLDTWRTFWYTCMDSELSLVGSENVHCFFYPSKIATPGRTLRGPSLDGSAMTDQRAAKFLHCMEGFRR